MRNTFKDYNVALKLMSKMSDDELKSEKLPAILQGLDRVSVQQAYARLHDKDLRNTPINEFFEEEYARAYEIISKMSKEDFLSGKLPEPLQGIDDVAIRLAYASFKNERLKGQLISTTIKDKGIYWCARDLGGSPIGHHHFVLIVGDENLKAFDDIEVIHKGSIYFYTFAAFKADTDKNEDRLKEEVNNETDVWSVNEECHWWKHDFDIQPHKITELSESDYSEIMGYMDNYYENQNKKDGVPEYDLTDCNCASWVNTLFKTMGISRSARDDYGEFWGVDWGEEDLFDETYFTEVKVEELV